MGYSIDRPWFDRKIASANLSMRKVARRLDMDPSALSRTLNGLRRMTLAEVRGMAAILGASEAEVLSHANTDGPNEPSQGLAEAPQTQLAPPREPEGAQVLVTPAQTDSKGRKLSPLFGALRGTTVVMPGVDLTEPADPDWGGVYDEDYDHDGSARGKRA